MSEQKRFACLVRKAELREMLHSADGAKNYETTRWLAEVEPLAEIAEAVETLQRQYEALGRSVAESGLVIAERLNALEAVNCRLLARLQALEMQVEMDRQKLADHTERLAALERAAATTEAVERGGYHRDI